MHLFAKDRRGPSQHPPLLVHKDMKLSDGTMKYRENKIKKAMRGGKGTLALVNSNSRIKLVSKERTDRQIAIRQKGHKNMTEKRRIYSNISLTFKAKTVTMKWLFLFLLVVPAILHKTFCLCQRF